MSEYARTMLMNMLTATVAGSDLTEVLAPVAGRGPVTEALIEGLGPVVGTLLQVGMGLGGRAAAGTVGLGQVEEELRTSGRELTRALMQAVMDAASAAEQPRPGGVDGPDGPRRTRVENGHARTVATVFGRITVRRKAYGPHGRRTCTRWTRCWTCRRACTHPGWPGCAPRKRCVTRSPAPAPRSSTPPESGSAPGRSSN